MNIGEIFTWITTNGPAIVSSALAVCGAAAMIAALTPTSKDDTVIAGIQNGIKKVADILGFNVMNAKNEK